MKYRIILFMLVCALLTGCSTTYQYNSPKITVVKKSGLKKDYFLMSVRGDSAIVALDWKYWKGYFPIPESLAVVLGKDSIARILRTYKGSINSGVGETFSVLSQTIITAPIVIVVGLPLLVWYCVYNLDPPSKEFLLASDTDRSILRSIALYPDKEPEEMQNIK